MTRDLDLLLPSPHPVGLIDPTGEQVAGAELPADTELLAAFAGLVTARRINDQASEIGRAHV